MDILDEIAVEVRRTIDFGYYEVEECVNCVPASLKEKLEKEEFSVISEIKPASPSRGKLLDRDVGEVAREMKSGGAAAISVLTEPKFFSGELENVEIAKRTKLPVLMKDFVLEPAQMEAGARAGADVVLLIVSLFERGYCSRPLDRMIADAHTLGLEVLLEAHSLEEFRKAKETDADIIGINNRDLGTMEVSLENTVRILGEEKADRPVVSESGIFTREDVIKVKEAGAKGALVGTSILSSGNIVEKLEELCI